MVGRALAGSLEKPMKKKKGALRLSLAAPLLPKRTTIAVANARFRYRMSYARCGDRLDSLLVLGRREERGQSIGRSVFRMANVGQAKGGLNRFQQRVVRLKPRVLNAAHAVIGNGDKYHFIVEVGRSVAVGARQQ